MDLPLLKRFITSVHNYWNLEELDQVIVVWNDTPRYRAQFEAELASWRRPELTIQSVWCETLWPQQDQWDWYSQQHLKLVVADLVNTEWYIIHDSKDFYVSKTGLSNFIKSNGQSCLKIRTTDHTDSWLGVHGFHYQHYKNAYDLFGLDYTDYSHALRTWEASVCPVHTQTIRDMNTHLKQQFGTLFPWMLLLQRNHETMFTEYALISAWHHKQGIMLDKYTLLDESGSFYGKIACNKDLRRKKTSV